MYTMSNNVQTLQLDAGVGLISKNLKCEIAYPARRFKQLPFSQANKEMCQNVLPLILQEFHNIVIRNISELIATDEGLRDTQFGKSPLSEVMDRTSIWVKIAALEGEIKTNVLLKYARIHAEGLSPEMEAAVITGITTTLKWIKRRSFRLLQLTECLTNPGKWKSSKLFKKCAAVQHLGYVDEEYLQNQLHLIDPADSCKERTRILAAIDNWVKKGKSTGEPKIVIVTGWTKYPIELIRDVQTEVNSRMTKLVPKLKILEVPSLAAKPFPWANEDMYLDILGKSPESKFTDIAKFIDVCVFPETTRAVVGFMQRWEALEKAEEQPEPPKFIYSHDATQNYEDSKANNVLIHSCAGRKEVLVSQQKTELGFRYIDRLKTQSFKAMQKQSLCKENMPNAKKDIPIYKGHLNAECGPKLIDKILCNYQRHYQLELLNTNVNDPAELAFTEPGKLSKLAHKTDTYGPKDPIPYFYRYEKANSDQTKFNLYKQMRKSLQMKPHEELRLFLQRSEDALGFDAPGYCMILTNKSGLTIFAIIHDVQKLLKEKNFCEILYLYSLKKGGPRDQIRRNFKVDPDTNYDGACTFQCPILDMTSGIFQKLLSAAPINRYLYGSPSLGMAHTKSARTMAVFNFHQLPGFPQIGWKKLAKNLKKAKQQIMQIYHFQTVGPGFGLHMEYTHLAIRNSRQTRITYQARGAPWSVYGAGGFQAKKPLRAENIHFKKVVNTWLALYITPVYQIHLRKAHHLVDSIEPTSSVLEYLANPSLNILSLLKQGVELRRKQKRMKELVEKPLIGQKRSAEKELSLKTTKTAKTAATAAEVTKQAKELLDNLVKWK